MKKNFIKYSGCHSHDTRFKQNIVTINPVNRFISKSTINTGIKIYNCLPLELKSMTTAQFRDNLKIFLKEEAFYSLNDFFDHFK